MARLIPSLILFTLSFQLVALLVAGPFPAKASSDVVNRVCHQVDRSDFCLQYLLHASWSLACPDLRCLTTRIIPNLVKPLAVATSNRIHWFLRHSPGNLEVALSDCVGYYDNVLGYLDDIQEQINSGAYAEAGVTEVSAEDKVVACVNAFSGKPNPITDRNNQVRASLNLLDEFTDLISP